MHLFGEPPPVDQADILKESWTRAKPDDAIPTATLTHMLKRDHRTIMDAYQDRHCRFMDGRKLHVDAILKANAAILQHALSTQDTDLFWEV